MKYAANCSTIDKHPAKLQRRQLQPVLLQPQHQQHQHIIAEAAPTLGQPASTVEHKPDPLKMLAKVTADLPSASSASANIAASGSCKEPRPLSRTNGQVDSTPSSNLSSHAKTCNKVTATLKPSAVDHINNWAESYQMPDEMSLWDDDGAYFSSQR
jgi:hypothetical protein